MTGLHQHASDGGRIGRQHRTERVAFAAVDDLQILDLGLGHAAGGNGDQCAQLLQDVDIAPIGAGGGPLCGDGTQRFGARLAILDGGRGLGSGLQLGGLSLSLCRQDDVVVEA
jgi:hypothetical protein